MDREACGYAVQQRFDRRTVLAGGRIVLEVCVTYPELTGAAEGDQDGSVFNDAYRRMADAFLRWGETAFAERAVREFEGMGASAAYAFDRRVLVCSMEGVAEETRIRVKRVVRYGRKRSGDEILLPEAEDVWLLPELTLTTRDSGHKQKEKL